MATRGREEAEEEEGEEEFVTCSKWRGKHNSLSESLSRRRISQERGSLHVTTHTRGRPG